MKIQDQPIIGWRQPPLNGMVKNLPGWLAISMVGFWNKSARRNRKRTVAARFNASAYIEYAYILDGKRVDAQATRHVYSGLNATTIIFTCRMAALPHTLAKCWRPGTIKRYSVDGKFCRKSRESSQLIPAKSARPLVDDPVPLLVVFDGQDYLPRLCL
jgi:hypothetical protein